MCNFDDFYNVVKQSNEGLVDVLVLSNEDFANFTGEQSQTKLKKLQGFLTLQFQCGSRHIQ